MNANSSSSFVPNSCSDYMTPREYCRIADDSAEYESLHESDLMPELTLLGFDARAELAEEIVRRIEAIGGKR